MKKANEDLNYLQKQYKSQQPESSYRYDMPYLNFAGTAPPQTTATTATTNIDQPLPGHPPLPPQLPPPSPNQAPPLPPQPHPQMFHQMPPQIPPQMGPMPTWLQTPPPQPWQWLTPQPAPPTSQTLPPQNANMGNYQRNNNFMRRDRFVPNRNANYHHMRGNGSFHRKNRKGSGGRFDQAQNQFVEHPGSYFGPTGLSGALALVADWQRQNFANSGNQGMVNQMPVNMGNQGHGMAEAAVARRNERSCEQASNPDEGSSKKKKQRKPMSQSYPSKPWDRSDAMRALQTENELNKSIKAQSLIIKFPDPDLNKDIVRQFHTGIQNIHFQSPSGPRYCFIQMAEDVDIDEAIKELEKIPFGNGFLKVERKSLQDKDNPMPEDIDPYILYIGNLPESVNVSEVKSKFPTAARIDVGYPQKMRNTRYAFIRYNTVDESIAAYKQSHDLMWGTRSLIVRFLRQRGNTCLPGELKTSGGRKVAISPAKSSKGDDTGENMKMKAVGNGEVRDEVKSQMLSDSLELSDADQENDVSSTNQRAQKNKFQASKAQGASSDVKTSGLLAQENALMNMIDIKEEPVDYEEDNDDDEDDDDDEESDKAYDDDDAEGLRLSNDGNDESENLFGGRYRMPVVDTIDDLDAMFENLDKELDDIKW